MWQKPVDLSEKTPYLGTWTGNFLSSFSYIIQFEILYIISNTQ